MVKIEAVFLLVFKRAYIEVSRRPYLEVLHKCFAIVTVDKSAKKPICRTWSFQLKIKNKFESSHSIKEIISTNISYC